MSREIKFRTWSKLYKQWCGGTNYIDGVWLGWICRNGKDIMTQDIILEQYTGLNDKNGEEIYEGDIVKWLNGLGEYTEFRVEWQDNRARVCLRNEYSEYDYEGLNDKKELYLEVIGNIHENPELVEAK